MLPDAMTVGKGMGNGYPVASLIAREELIRAAVLETMQRLVIDKAIYAPIWQLAFINGVGPRVAESDFGRRTRVRLYRAL